MQSIRPLLLCGYNTVHQVLHWYACSLHTASRRGRASIESCTDAFISSPEGGKHPLPMFCWPELIHLTGGWEELHGLAAQENKGNHLPVSTAAMKGKRQEVGITVFSPGN